MAPGNPGTFFLAKDKHLRVSKLGPAGDGLPWREEKVVESGLGVDSQGERVLSAAGALVAEVASHKPLYSSI